MPELQTILTYRVWRENDGEGQALALREGRRFFQRSAGALGCHTRSRAGFPHDVERFMKPSQLSGLASENLRNPFIQAARTVTLQI